MEDDYGFGALPDDGPLREVFCFGCLQCVFIRPRRDTLCPSCGTSLPPNMSENQARSLGEYVSRNLILHEDDLERDLEEPNAQQIPHGLQPTRPVEGVRNGLQLGSASRNQESSDQNQNEHEYAAAEQQFMEGMMRFMMAQQQQQEETEQSSQGASQRAVDSLRRHHVKNADDIPLQVSLKVDSLEGEMVLIPANFGPSIAEVGENEPVASLSSCSVQENNTGTHREDEATSAGATDPSPSAIKKFRDSQCVLNGRIVPCNPLTGKELHGDSSLEGAIAFASRGDISFADKARAVQKQGARALIVQQTFDVWPYTMTDKSTNGRGVNIPVLMLRKENGEAVLDRIRADHTRPIRGAIFARSASSRCPITREKFENEEIAVEMPCGHWFSEDGLLYWLKTHSTCPLCRYQLEKSKDQQRPRATAADVGSFEDASGPSGAFALWYL
eukprot:gb/GECG01014410.1/.p1 GENE.gb/GECG01014410.1/~~gb/GECG01014410.1/.p1  ORF type:complete len:444 (+),score=62.87 gb/GECG01014410.1/:1-1332(+)